MSLPIEADPDRQMPMPHPAADAYAQDVMRWARELDTAAIPSGMNIQRDVAYGPHRLHRYNVFSPPGARNAPVLVCWHGGGWTNGYRDYVTFMAPHVVGMGCVLVAPSYRLVVEAPLPAAFDDSLQMLAHVVQHIAQWGGAPQRLLLSGSLRRRASGSAGGPARGRPPACRRARRGGARLSAHQRHHGPAPPRACARQPGRTRLHNGAG